MVGAWWVHDGCIVGAWWVHGGCMVGEMTNKTHADKEAGGGGATETGRRGRREKTPAGRTEQR